MLNINYNKMRTRYFILIGFIMLLTGSILKDLTILETTSIFLMVIGSVSFFVLTLVTYLDERIEF